MLLSGRRGAKNVTAASVTRQPAASKHESKLLLLEQTQAAFTSLLPLSCIHILLFCYGSTSSFKESLCSQQSNCVQLFHRLCCIALMTVKPEWEVLADLALRRLEKDYQRTLQAKPIVRFKEGDIVSLAGMSTAVLEGAKGIIVGPMDPASCRYPVKISSPEVLLAVFPAFLPSCALSCGLPISIEIPLHCILTPISGCCACLSRRCQVSAGPPGRQLRQQLHPRTGSNWVIILPHTCTMLRLHPLTFARYAALSKSGHAADANADDDDDHDVPDSDSSGDDWEAPRAVEGHSSCASCP